MHGGAGVLAADVVGRLHKIRHALAAALGLFKVGVASHNIVNGVDAVEMLVRHAQFLTLINVGRSLHQVEADSQHFGRPHTGFFVLGAAEARHYTGLVVVVPVQAVPRLAIQTGLPAGLYFFNIRQLPRVFGFPLTALAAVNIHQFKLEHHVQLMAILARVQAGKLRVDVGVLAHRHAVVVAQHTAVHLLQVFMHTGTVGTLVGIVAVQTIGAKWPVCISGLGDHADDVHAKAVDALLEPEVHHVKDLIANLRVLPVQIGLSFSKKVQVILTGFLVVLPRRAAEAAAPVVGGTAVRGGVFPDIIVAFGVVAAGTALNKPRVLVRRVVDHQVHDEL